MIHNLIKTVSTGLTTANRCIIQFRCQNFHSALKLLKEFSNHLMLLINDIMQENKMLQEHGCVVDIQYLTTVLSGVMEAQENRDYVLLPDLLELQAIPFLMQLQENLIAYGYESDDFFEENLSRLCQTDRALYNELKNYKPDNSCFVEPTSSGHLTMRIEDETGSYYLHSNVNPVLEGDVFAGQYYSEENSHYVVFGLGLGYHIQSLLQLDDGIYIDIMEPDLAIIWSAFSVTDMSWLLDNARIRLKWDSEYQLLKEDLKDGKTLLIHYPSLRHIKKTDVKLSMEKYFIHDSGIRNMSHQFVNNFRDNVVHCKHYVDELKPRFGGKNAIIVAAGPSLDKNVELLKNCPADTIIVSVGTVFRKLITMGIKPDYVVFLDAQPHLYKQIDGLESQDVPIICAATACKKIAEQYEGEKYLICQQGYDKAEDYAGEHGCMTYETGGSVSTIALDMCLKLGCGSVAFVGLDLAFTGNHTHATDTADYAAENEEHKEMIPAIGGGMVAASKLFIIYREWIERRVARIDNNIEVIDATEGGALKKGLKNMTLSEVFEEWRKL